MVMLAKIRRMHFRDGLPLREIAKRTGLSRNTIRRWLRSGQSELGLSQASLALPARSLPVPVGDVAACRQPSSPAGTTHRQGVAPAVAGMTGYPGTYTRVTAFIRQWKGRRRQPPPGLRAVALSLRVKPSSSTGAASTPSSAATPRCRWISPT